MAGLSAMPPVMTDDAADTSPTRSPQRSLRLRLHHRYQQQPNPGQLPDVGDRVITLPETINVLTDRTAKFICVLDPLFLLVFCSSWADQILLWK